jgi:hypothetical protein
MKPVLTGIAVALSILVAAIMLQAEASTLPPEPVVQLKRVFVGHLHNVAELIKSQPDVVRPYLDDMFSIASDMRSRMEALDPLCRAYPQTDSQWRKESFLSYVLSCRENIQGALKILATIANSNLPGEVRGEARRLREDVQKMAEWIELLIVAANSTPEATPKTKQP